MALRVSAAGPEPRNQKLLAACEGVRCCVICALKPRSPLIRQETFRVARSLAGKQLSARNGDRPKHVTTASH